MHLRGVPAAGRRRRGGGRAAAAWWRGVATLTVPYFDETSTRTGLVRQARWSFLTLEVIVAEKRYVDRSRGHAPRIVSSSFSKSMLSSLSASSSTTTRVPRTEKPLVFLRWSTRRPGVPTTTCGRFASRIACCTMSTPPTTVAHLTPMCAPSASNCSEICRASSRVGEMTRAKSGCGLSSRRCSTGRPNAAVLPEPVSASPMMSRPCSAHGIASHWMGDGALKPSALHASQSGSASPSDANVFGASPLSSAPLPLRGSSVRADMDTRRLHARPRGTFTHACSRCLRRHVANRLSVRLDVWPCLRRPRELLASVSNRPLIGRASTGANG